MYSDSSEFSSEHYYRVADFEPHVPGNSGVVDRISSRPNFPRRGTGTCNDACGDPRFLQRFEKFQAMQNQEMEPSQLLNPLQRKTQLPVERNPVYQLTREGRPSYTRAMMMKLQGNLTPNLDNCEKPDLKYSSQDPMDQGYNTQDTSSVGTVESVGQQGMNSIDCHFPNGMQEVRRTVKQTYLRAHQVPELVTIATKVEPLNHDYYLPHDDPEVSSTSSDDDNNWNFSVMNGDYVVSEDEPLQSSAAMKSLRRIRFDTARGSYKGLDVAKKVEFVEPEQLRHSAGNEPDPFVKYYTVRLHDRGNRLTARSVLRQDHFVKAFGAPPKSMTYNSLGNVVIQVEDEDQGAILSRTTSLGGFDIETRPHSTLNNVTGIVVSDRLWKEGCSTKVVQELAHEGVISATIYEPILLQDGTVSHAIGITFGNRSSLAISVKTRSGYQLDVRVRVVPPKQCLVCFRFGHETDQCRELDAICENCSKYRHDHQQPCKRLTRCANCGSSRHGALSRHCFALYKAWRIAVVAFTEMVAFMKAKRRVDDEVEDCLRRGGDYVNEFPLTSRYFLIVPQEQLANTVSRSSTARSVIICSYPEMFANTDPGEYMNCSQLLDYYCVNDSKVGVKNEALRSPSASRDMESRWSLPAKPPPIIHRPSLLKQQQVASENGNKNSLPHQDPVGVLPSYCRNSSYKSTDEHLDPMPLLIHFVNRYSVKALNVGMLSKADSPVGLVKFCDINLRCVSGCWQEGNARSTLNSNNLVIKRKMKSSGTIWNDDHHDNSMRGKLVEGDTFDDCTDVYAASRCKRFIRGRECSEKCGNIHRLPKEDGIRCISRKLGQCLDGRQCNFLHDGSDEDNEPVAIRHVRDCNANEDCDYDDYCNYDYDGGGGAGEGVYYDGRSSSSSSSEDDGFKLTAMAVGPLLRLFNRYKN